ncbi:MAG TPA: gamma-glutamylcyclotransferase [Albidovulum sp.]|uniref:gamma-glutamylcyclotransferase n=1 Tax=Albidovulum sp. TaxID=1872424 RepID=UPI002B8F5731|nr:gamma-glutamylcyclotransferase [Albidovulum sp.]
MWVFGYGSLLWEPGFDFTEKVMARLDGWHRSFCMRSIHHRGTEAEPGLVLALDAASGGACTGLAFGVAPEKAESVLAYLRERELISSAYLERLLPVTLAGGRMVEAVAYVIDPDHVQYCGGLPLDEQAAIIARARGGRGENRDYLWNTARHLHELGIADPELDWLAARVRHLAGTP